MISGSFHHSRDVLKLRKYLPKRAQTELDAALLVQRFCFMIWLLLTFLFHNMTSVTYVLYDVIHEYMILQHFNNIFHFFWAFFHPFFKKKKKKATLKRAWLEKSSKYYFRKTIRWI